MRDARNRLKALLGVLLVGIAVLAILGITQVSASVEPSPSSSSSSIATASSSPTPSTSATPIPQASSATVEWARRQKTGARKQWNKWNHARRSFRLRVVPFYQSSDRSPARAKSEAVWRAVGRGWKHDKAVYARKFGALRYKMAHPGGSSNGVRWKPLARWVGWPESTLGTLASILLRESSGRPRVLCGGYVLPAGAGDGQPDSRAGGLTQLKPAPRHWADPEFNLRYAYQKKYLPCLHQYGNGWSPWAL